MFGDVFIVHCKLIKNNNKDQEKEAEQQNLQPVINTYQITKILTRKTQDLLVTIKYQSVKTTSWFKIFNNKIDYILIQVFKNISLWTI